MICVVSWGGMGRTHQGRGKAGMIGRRVRQSWRWLSVPGGRRSVVRLEWSGRRNAHLIPCRSRRPALRTAPLFPSPAPPPMLHWLLLIHLIVGGVTLVVYAFDKWASMRQRRRVPETTLHLLALLGGVSGAIVGQWALRHKVRKRGFVAATVLIAMLHGALLLWAALS
ncbi:MAG: DUF1294 domain-containing protein [Phycisphaeraceae bacterium]|nr:MAG: DUF1294 domain-containing protein [Phycisphaeraceae bacterium]